VKRIEDLIIISSQAEAAVIALNELQKIEPKARSVRLSPEVQLITNFNFKNSLHSTIFIRHAFPVQFSCHFSDSSYEHLLCDVLLKKLCVHQSFPKDQAFSIQMRNLSGDFEYPKHIENSLIKMGYIKDDSAPIWALSLLSFNRTLFAGASYCKDNLSSWNGGMMRFKRDGNSFISRAEFKLLEALSVFKDVIGDRLVQAKQALDLGAAPGGWSKILLDRIPGLEVTAVDPAQLNASVRTHPQLRHIKDIAQRLVTDKKLVKKFDIIVNDMRMDMMDSARIMLDLCHTLSDDGFAIMTLKLPHSQWYKNTKRACALLEKSYQILAVKQLFHNRSEVTVCVKRKEV